MLACAGRAKLTRTTIDVNALIVEMLEMLKALVPKRAKLQFGPGSDLPLVAGDASQLRQVIMNLVINAAEATEGRAVGIEITTSLARLSGRLTDRFVHQDGLEPGDYVAIRVRDDGVGMDAATIQRIFEPFYSTKFAGRGLGLPAVFGIVRGHGGGIRVESSPGAGSTLTAYLPASGAATATAEAPAAAEERAYRGRGTVLLVDDEDLVREVGQRLLRAIGFDVIAAANGREAIERFAAYRDAIVAVVLDLTMPDSDGFEVLRKLRQEDPSVRVVIASGYSQSDVERRYPSSPPAAFLEKPFGLAALREALHAALEK
jgi:CheY-like chemotaxis protein